MLLDLLFTGFGLVLVGWVNVLFGLCVAGFGCACVLGACCGFFSVV